MNKYQLKESLPTLVVLLLITVVLQLWYIIGAIQDNTTAIENSDDDISGSIDSANDNLYNMSNSLDDIDSNTENY